MQSNTEVSCIIVITSLTCLQKDHKPGQGQGRSQSQYGLQQESRGSTSTKTRTRRYPTAKIGGPPAKAEKTTLRASTNPNAFNSKDNDGNPKKRKRNNNVAVPANTFSNVNTTTGLRTHSPLHPYDNNSNNSNKKRKLNHNQRQQNQPTIPKPNTNYNNYRNKNVQKHQNKTYPTTTKMTKKQRRLSQSPNSINYQQQIEEQNKKAEEAIAKLLSAESDTPSTLIHGLPSKEGLPKFHYDGHLDPQFIYFTQGYVNPYFSHAPGQTPKSIFDLRDTIIEDPSYLYKVPVIRVSRRKGQYYSPDNRRLWVLRHANLSEVPVKLVKWSPEFINKLDNGKKEMKRTDVIIREGKI